MNLLRVGFLCSCLVFLGNATGLGASFGLFSPAFDQAALARAMDGYIIGSAELVGSYQADH